MSNSTTNTYTVDEIHKMRINIAEQYKKMSPDKAELNFKFHVENAKRTMEKIRKERRLSQTN